MWKVKRGVICDIERRVRLGGGGGGGGLLKRWSKELNDGGGLGDVQKISRLTPGEGQHICRIKRRFRGSLSSGSGDIWDLLHGERR